MSKIKGGSRDLVAYMVECFGWKRAAELLGVFTIAGATGVGASREAFLKAGHIGSQATRYRVMGDLETFVSWLDERGLLEASEADPAMAGLVMLGSHRRRVTA